MGFNSAFKGLMPLKHSLLPRDTEHAKCKLEEFWVNNLIQ